MKIIYILDGKPILRMDQYSEIKYSGIQPLYSPLPSSLLPSPPLRMVIKTTKKARLNESIYIIRMVAILVTDYILVKYSGNNNNNNNTQLVTRHMSMKTYQI